MKPRKASKLRTINPEWWLLLSVFGVSAAVSLVPFGGRMMLFLYLAPVMVAAYWYGRRKGILTAVSCVLVVFGALVFKAVLLEPNVRASLESEHWSELAMWGALLIGFGWGLGGMFGEYRETHVGFVDIMRYMVGRDNDQHNYVRRLSYLSGVIAEEMNLPADQCEIVRRAALLRDIGQLNLSRETFRRFSTICQQEDVEPQQGTSTVSLSQVMDIVLADKIYGTKSDRLPVGAKILALAAEYDDLTTSKRRRSALPPSVARTMIERESGKRFDSAAVRAFSRACQAGAFSPSARRFSAAAD
jgi:hypothetical protein